MAKSTHGSGRGQTTGGGQQNTQPSRWRIIARYSRLDPVAKFSFWVMVFTGLLAFSTIVQVWAFIQSERSLLSISISVVDFKFPEPPYDFLPVKVSIHNGGKSGALIVNGGLNFVTGVPQFVLPQNPSYVSMREEFRTLVLAGETIHRIAAMAPTKRPQQPWGPEEAEAIRAGTQKFLIFGFVEYEDDFSIFGFKRTGFCLKYIYYKQIGDGWVGCGLPNYEYAN
jgi:hypothetical protein